MDVFNTCNTWQKKSLAPAASEAKRDYVLVIDDDPAIVNLLVELLHEDEGFSVRTAYSVQQVVGKSPPAAPPGLILLDITLPGEEAMSLVPRLRHLPGWQEAPIVLCSGQDDVGEIATQVGAAAYLSKPFSLDDVANLAHHFIP